MLSFKNRLKKEKDFKRVFDYGKSISSDLISVKYLINEMENSRVGFIVSKKVSKKAVLRNRIKRVLRESVRKEIKQLNRGYDIIIIARRKTTETESKEIFKTVEDLFKSIR